MQKLALALALVGALVGLSSAQKIRPGFEEEFEFGNGPIYRGGLGRGVPFRGDRFDDGFIGSDAHLFSILEKRGYILPVSVRERPGFGGPIDGALRGGRLRRPNGFGGPGFRRGGLGGLGGINGGLGGVNGGLGGVNGGLGGVGVGGVGGGALGAGAFSNGAVGSQSIGGGAIGERADFRDNAGSLNALNAGSHDFGAGSAVEGQAGSIAGRKDFDSGQHFNVINDKSGLHKHQVLNTDKTIIKDRSSGVNDVDSFHFRNGVSQGSHLLADEAGSAQGASGGKVAGERENDRNVNSLQANHRDTASDIAAGAIGGGAHSSGAVENQAIGGGAIGGVAGGL